ncbi:PREDICTED: pre-mRNA-splicing factor 38B-like [Nanorana parkeri]|uniref:pre-mRNA-splicing factor 38B-like n=1 Tax=Nanorana parkeri TaxID=125878 RepID=UPI000854D6AB|nr:PREDICTED: pre-mRNA-splicing factor 38B-like [Nanorana parkeri]
MEEELERKAVEELLKEAQRGKDRAETMGPMGWMKCPLVNTNKRFLINTIKNTLPSDREKRRRRSPDEKESRDRSQERRYSRKHSAHPYKRSEESKREKSRSPSSSSKSTKQSHSEGDHKRR